MTHHVTLELSDEIYQPLLETAQLRGQPLETVAQDCLARTLLDKHWPLLRWCGALESNIPDLATEHDKYLGQALAGYMTTTSGRKLAFAAFVNGVHMKDGVDTKRVGRDLGTLCEIVHGER